MNGGVSLPHLGQLDGLRAIAILLVFVAHCGLDKIVPGGLGVTIFFFLSGYLITSLMRSEGAQTGRIDLKAFYIRRTLRIWPSLYLTMAFTTAAILLLLPDIRIALGGIVMQALFLENYAIGWIDGRLPTMPLWSLAVEEHYYLLLPILYSTLLIRMPVRRAAMWCAIACVALLIVRLVLAPIVPDIYYLYHWTHTRIDSILFGSVLALWNNPVLDKDAWRPKLWQLGLAIGAILICLVIRDEWFRQTLRYSIQGVALFVIFSWVLWDRGIASRLLSSPPMRLIGLYSYTLYLCHMLFILLVETYAPTLPVAGIILGAGAMSMAYAALMYRLVERPFARWRRSLHSVDKDATVA